MKKLTAIAALLIVFALILAGCGGSGNSSGQPSAPNTANNSASQSNTAKPADNTAKPADNTAKQEDPAKQEEPANSGSSELPPDYPTDIPPAWTPPTYQESLTDKIPFSVDLGVGWEFRDLSVNGVHRRITATFEMESSMIQQDPCYTYYRVDVIGDGMYAETVAVGRYFFEGFILEYVRSEEPEMLYMEVFEYDFKAASFKGKDREYIVCSIPAGWDQGTATMFISNDQGKLLADTMVSKAHQVTLQGDNVEKYMDSAGSANFFSLSENEITYLKVFQRVDGVTYLKEYSLDIDNDQITSVETGRTYTTTDTVDDLPGLSIY